MLHYVPFVFTSKWESNCLPIHTLGHSSRQAQHLPKNCCTIAEGQTLGGSSPSNAL